MIKRKDADIQPGNRFVKVGEATSITWEVLDLRPTGGGIIHARLKSCDIRANQITIGAGVLADMRFWNPAAVQGVA